MLLRAALRLPDYRSASFCVAPCEYPGPDGMTHDMPLDLIEFAASVFLLDLSFQSSRRHHIVLQTVGA